MSMQSTTTQQTMNRHTTTAMFDRRADAASAVEELVKAGIPRTSVRMTSESDVTTTTSYDTSRDDKGFWASLGDMFIPDEDRAVHAEAMHRGHIMVAVMVDQAHAAIAEDILEQHGTVNLEEQEASWRKTGRFGGSGSNGGARRHGRHNGVNGGLDRDHPEAHRDRCARRQGRRHLDL